MADLHIQTEHPNAQAPLLNSYQNYNHHQNEEQDEEEEDTHLDKILWKFETFLSFLGFKQSSVKSFVLSLAGFVALGVLVPVLVLELSECSGCEKYQMKDFELGIVVSQVCLAAVSLGCLAHNLRKHGIRKFLFVDKDNGQMSRLRDQYIQQIKVRWNPLNRTCLS